MMKNGNSETDKKLSAVGNERGVALIIVLVMLLLLTILGASMLATSTSELRIAGNHRNSLESFYAADAAMEIARSYEKVYTNITPGDVNFWPKPGEGKILGSDLVGSGQYNTENSDYNRITITSGSGNQSTADVKVEYLYDGPPPDGFGFGEDATVGVGGGTEFKSNVYGISVIAYGPNNTVAMHKSQTARIVPIK